MSGRLDRIPGVVLVSLAAAMWGLDGLIRKPLADSTSAYTIVFGEHVVLVLITLPLLVPAMVALWRAGPANDAGGIAVGAGASVLGEQPRRGFIWFLLAALVGIWLISLPHPFEPHVHGLTPVAETLAAATLWAMGTVFGRFLTRRLRFEHVLTVRFAFGLVAAACALPIVGAPAFAGLHDSVWIAVLALVTGLFALGLYYYGLQRTPALLASLGELAFPVTTTLVGIYVFDSSLRWTQWVGVALTVTVISLLPVKRRQLVKLPAGEPAFVT